MASRLNIHHIITLLALVNPQLRVEEEVTDLRWIRLWKINSKKLRHHHTLSQMKQLYYTLIYPYITCAIIAWPVVPVKLTQTKSKSNKIVSDKLLYFAKLCDNETESALPVINLLELLTVENIFYLNILKVIHKWKLNKLPKQFDSCLTLKAYGKKSYTKAQGGGSIGPLPSTFNTINLIDQIFGTYNERSLYFQLIETICRLIGFHGNYSNIMTSLAAAILDFQIFRFFPNSNLNTENSKKTAFSNWNL